MRARVAVFDFDGTLFDSFEVVYAINRAMLPGLEREDFRAWFDGSPLDVIAQSYPTYSNDDFFRRYDEAVRVWRLSDEAVAVIRAVRERCDVAIVSSSYGWLISRMLARSGISFVERVYGGDVAHSKAEKFEMVARDFGVSFSSMLFVTDTVGDVREANRAGVRTLAYVGEGAFHARERFEGVEVVGFIDRLRDVIEYL